MYFLSNTFETKSASLYAHKLT